MCGKLITLYMKGKKMKMCKWVLLLILSPVILFGEILVYSDFEDGQMDNWVPKMSNECWSISGSYPLEGNKSLKAVDLKIADNIYAYTNVTYDLSSYTYEWKFMAKSSSSLSASTTYYFWLAADNNDFNDSSIKGYVVGINYNGETDDKLAVWKVNGTSDVTKIIDTDVDVSNDILAIKVIRSSSGLWKLYYNKSNSFDGMTLGGTATDTSITTGLTTTGPYYISAKSYSGGFRFDECTISRSEETITEPLLSSSEGTDVTVTVGCELSFDVTATVSVTSFGGLFSTNKPGGSTFLEQTDNFPLSSTFRWTPDSVGSYSAVFTATNEAGATDLIVNIEVEDVTVCPIWINEFHYDNTSTDKNEGVEIAGKAGIDLSNYTVYTYNGSDGGISKTLALYGTIPNEDNSNYGAAWFDLSLQNDTEGIALVKNDPQEVLYFISYEGTVTATEGPANGMESVDIGIKEGSKDETYSLQLIGNGSKFEDFTWTEQIRTPGNINTGQTMKTKGSVFFIK